MIGLLPGVRAKKADAVTACATGRATLQPAASAQRARKAFLRAGPLAALPGKRALGVRRPTSRRRGGGGEFLAAVLEALLFMTSATTRSSSISRSGGLPAWVSKRPRWPLEATVKQWTTTRAPSRHRSVASILRGAVTRPPASGSVHYGVP